MSSPSSHTTAAADRVPVREKIGLGLGRVVGEGTHGTLHVLVNPIYNMTLGVNPAWLSTTVFVQRLWDAMLDPLIGSFSDNFRSRWGRRLPLIAIAALPLAALFAALWFFPRDASPDRLFWHLLVVSLIFYAAHSLYSMPLGGLVLEATDDYHERTRLASIIFAFGFAFQITSQWLFPLTQLAAFGDTITGLRWVAAGCGVAFLIAGLAPLWLCRERHYGRVAGKQPRTSLFASLRAVRDNRDFLSLLTARFVLALGYNLVGMLGLYMNAYFVFGGDLKAAGWAYGFLGSSFHVAAILMSLFVYPWLTRRYGKKRTLQIAIFILLGGCASKLVVYHPGMPWLQFFVLATNGAANAGFGLVANAMLGDVADADELRSGLRREALFNSLLSWFEKAGNSVGSLVAGFLLVWIGFNAKLGAQAAGTLQAMQLAYFALPTAGALLALWCLRRYDLTEARAYEIKDALALRRAAAAVAPFAMINAAFILGAPAFADIYGEENLRAITPPARLLGPPCTAAQLQASPPSWLAEVEVLFTGWDAPRLDSELLARMPRLKAVFYGAGSIRPIASDALWERGIFVSSAAALNAQPVVEFTLGAILLSFKRVWHHARKVREDRVYEATRALPVATGWGATIGLVSLGLIGRRVAEQLAAYDVKVLAYDPLASAETFAAIRAQPVSLAEIFDRSDIISLHTPLLKETRGMIDASLLGRLRPGATLINTARGGIIREADLIATLQARPDVQAILDVTDPEPPVRESPLFDLPNVFLTPHIAGSIGVECRRMGRAMVDEFHRYARGEPLQHRVTREQLARMA